MDAFPSKKGARANAAKEAVEYLVDKGEVNADGTSKGRKKVKIGAAVRVQGEGLKVQRDTSFAQKVTGRYMSSLNTLFDNSVADSSSYLPPPRTYVPSIPP